METLLRSRPSVPAGPHQHWQREPSADRPLYDCPTCHERAMQFHHLLTDNVYGEEREDTFLCCACGRTWEM